MRIGDAKKQDAEKNQGYTPLEGFLAGHGADFNIPAERAFGVQSALRERE